MRSRFVPVVGAMLGTLTVCGTMTASPVFALGAVFMTLVFVVVVWFVRRRSLLEPAWSGPIPSEVPVRSTPGRSEVVRALARVESRELLVNPWFGVGLGFLLVILTTLGFFFADNDSTDNGSVWMQTIHFAPWYAHPLAGMTIVAAFRGATRSRRDGTDEMFDSCPTGRDVRTVANLRTFVVPVAAFLAFLVIFGTSVAVQTPHLHGPVTWGAVPILAASFVLLVGAIFLGSALASWLPHAVVPIVAVFAIGLFSLRLRSDGDPGWNGLASLSTFGPEAEAPLLIALTFPWSYLAWIVGLTGIVGVIAVARHRRSTGVWAAGAISVVLAVVAGTAATRPVDAEAAAATANLILHPSEHQSCATSNDQAVSVCTFRAYPELRSRVLDSLVPITPELEYLRGPVTVRQVYENSIVDLPEPVRDIVGTRAPGAAPGEIGIGIEADDQALNAARLKVALSALDIPYLRSEDALPLPLSGQARGVFALWIATRGLDLDDAIEVASVDTEWETPDDAFDRGNAWPSGCAPVVWAAQDLEAARTIMALPDGMVRDVLKHDVDRWKNPSTSTDDLMAALGLDAVGPFEVVVARAEDWC